jgi:GNAT superfamily N-acetyltransferase
MGTPSIRPAVPGEAARLTAIAFAAKAHWGYPASLLARWRESLTVTDASLEAWPTFVAERDGGPVGFCQLRQADGAWCLEHLWVAPGAIGGGAGRGLLRRAANAAADAGADRLEIDADPNALGFYLACGAIETGRLPAPVPGDPGRCRPQLHVALHGHAAERGPEPGTDARTAAAGPAGSPPAARGRP